MTFDDFFAKIGILTVGKITSNSGYLGKEWDELFLSQPYGEIKKINPPSHVQIEALPGRFYHRRTSVLPDFQSCRNSTVPAGWLHHMSPKCRRDTARFLPAQFAVLAPYLS